VFSDVAVQSRSGESTGEVGSRVSRGRRDELGLGDRVAWHISLAILLLDEGLCVSDAVKSCRLLPRREQQTGAVDSGCGWSCLRKGC